MISLTLQEIGERGEIGEPLLESDGTIPDVLQALDTFLLSNEQDGRAFDLTIQVYDETGVCLAGNPARGGKCGDPDCVCA